MNYLPINTNILNTHSADCWAYYCYLYQTISNTHCSFSNTSITINITLNAARSKYGRLYADLGPTVWCRYKPQWEVNRILIVDTPTTMMPLEVFDKVHAAIMPLPSRSRTGYLRLYLYVYFMCHKCSNDFGISINRLSAEMGANTADVCKKIDYFIRAGLLRRMGKYNADLGLAYRYFIPIEYCSGLN